MYTLLVQVLADMARRQCVYDEYHSVDDDLLHQISKAVRYNELGALSRELGIPETERQRAVANKSPNDQIFEVGNTSWTEFVTNNG